MVRLIARLDFTPMQPEQCFNSRDGAIDSQTKIATSGPNFHVSIPEMVRLIERNDRKAAAEIEGFNSRDGAIDRITP